MSFAEAFPENGGSVWLPCPQKFVIPGSFRWCGCSLAGVFLNFISKSRSPECWFHLISCFQCIMFYVKINTVMVPGIEKYSFRTLPGVESINVIGLISMLFQVWVYTEYCTLGENCFFTSVYNGGIWAKWHGSQKINFKCRTLVSNVQSRNVLCMAFYMML